MAIETSSGKIWQITEGPGALVAAAVHDGHLIREEVIRLSALTDDERLREEDPFTGSWTALANTRIVGLHSRFEVDLNRPPEKAVYQRPEDAWGLNLWQDELPQPLVQRSMDNYHNFYREVYQVLTRKQKEHGRFFVFDLHTYNHRREGPDGPVADPEQNPEVNIGTGTMDRNRWAKVIDRFIDDLSSFEFNGRKLDVRENIKFKGGYFSKWIHQQFPESGCAIAVEFKKFFMDEWTGEPDKIQVELISQALRSTLPGLQEVFGNENQLQA